jgi:Zn-dependent protease
MQRGIGSRNRPPSLVRGMDAPRRFRAEPHGYDGSVSQVHPEYETHEPPELPRDFRDYEPVQPRGTDWREVGRRIWAPIAAIGAFIAKFGVGILKYKFLLGLFISFGAYLWYGGIWFAVGLIGLIFVHEMGHWLEAKRQGLPVSAPLFIPFLGASIFLKEHPESAWREFQLAIAGPLLGSLGAFAVWAIAEAEDSNRLRAIAFLGFFINLFNLLPVVPLDGGRIVTAIHPALWVLGLVGLLALVIWRPNGLLVLILIFAAMELWQRWQQRRFGGAGDYYAVTPSQRLLAGASYFGLAVLLVVAMHETHVPHTF